MAVFCSACDSSSGRTVRQATLQGRARQGTAGHGRARPVTAQLSEREKLADCSLLLCHTAHWLLSYPDPKMLRKSFKKSTTFLLAVYGKMADWSNWIYQVALPPGSFEYPPKMQFIHLYLLYV